jgi:hypothetical protein
MSEYVQVNTPHVLRSISFSRYTTLSNRFIVLTGKKLHNFTDRKVENTVISFVELYALKESLRVPKKIHTDSFFRNLSKK